jgi:predicted dehydrogenase
MARDGVLGRPRGLRTIRVQAGNRHDEDAVWVLAPHELAIAREILGEVPRPRAGSGVWDGDRLVTLHALLDTELGWHVCEVSERAPAVERRVELHCDDGIAVLAGGWDEHVLVYRADGSEPERVGALGELPLLAELRAFLGFVNGGPPPRSSAAEGAAAVKAIVRLRELAS